MTDRVNTRVNAMKSPSSDPPADLLFSPASPEELPPGHQPMLPLRERRNRPVVSARS